MTLRMWLLCLVCAAGPAWGLDGKDGGAPAPEDQKDGGAPAPESKEAVLEELGWTEGGGDDAWKEACAFAPGGELWRLSGSSGNTVSNGVESFALRRQGETVLRLGQEGPEEFGGGATIDESERWKVRCQPGQVDIVTPAITVSVQVGDTQLTLDPRFLRILRPGSRELEDAAVQSLDEVLDGIWLERVGGGSEGPEVLSGLSEARLRARLLNIERVLARGDLNRAHDMLTGLPASPDLLEQNPDLPELSNWVEDLRRRLKDLRSKPPLMATGARRVGALMSLPKPLHKEDNPILFWRGTQLCVRQEASKPPRMRCVEAGTGSWGKEEPYRSPYGKGWRVDFEKLGWNNGYQTQVASFGPESGTTELTNWEEPVVVARGKKGQLVVVEAPDPTKHQGLEEFDLASGPGSLLAGGRQYYFSKPDELRSLKAEGLAWTFVVPVSGSEVRCAVPPRVSPDGRWAACPAAQAGAEGTPNRKTPEHFDLLLFGLTPRAP